MATVRPDFKRMLLRLPHSPRDYPAITLVADLAAILGADLIGTYVDDIGIRSLVDLPDAREFRAGTWQPLKAGQLALELESAMREAEQLFLRIAGQRPSAPSFRVVESASAAAQEAGSDDILVVIEPKSPLERATRQFSDLLEAAYRSASSILWVPSTTRRFAGPVVVLASEPDDPCLSAALAIAASARERVILVPANSAVESLLPALERAKAAGVATTLAEAVFHHDTLLLPPHIKAGLLIAGREHALPPTNPLQIPVLLISSKRTSPAPKSGRSRPA